MLIVRTPPPIAQIEDTARAAIAAARPTLAAKRKASLASGTRTWNISTHVISSDGKISPILFDFRLTDAESVHAF
jgi:hypothetical protein